MWIAEDCDADASCVGGIGARTLFQDSMRHLQRFPRIRCCPRSFKRTARGIEAIHEGMLGSLAPGIVDTVLGRSAAWFLGGGIARFRSG